MTTTTQLPLRIDGLDEYQTLVIDRSPQWLKTLRQRAVAQFVQMGLPTYKDEEFKYTSLVELSNKRFHLPSNERLTGDDPLENYVDQNDINIVLLNGTISEELSNIKNLPVGLKVMPFSEAAVEYPQEVESTISKMTANDPKSFVALNQALFLDGVFIKVEDEASISSLLHVIHVTCSSEENAVVFPRVLIHVGASASVHVLESHVSQIPVLYWSNALTDLRIGPRAKVSYCKAEAESPRAILTTTTRIWQEKESVLEAFSFCHRAHLVRNNLSILLKGENTTTTMNGFYALDGKQHVDNHTLLDIQQPNCTSFQVYKGILNDSARAVFNGKIYVHPIAQKTNGYQLNKHLLLGKDARIDTKPQLEIFADDVKCTHGATIGQINEDEVFYLQSRCISRETATQLLSRGFIDDIINTIKLESVRNKLNHWLTVKFPQVKL